MPSNVMNGTREGYPRSRADIFRARLPLTWSASGFLFGVGKMSKTLEKGRAAVGPRSGWMVPAPFEKRSYGWKAIAEELLTPLPPEERAAVISAHMTVETDVRQFRPTAWKTKEETAA